MTVKPFDTCQCRNHLYIFSIINIFLLASLVGFEPARQRFIASQKPNTLLTELSGRPKHISTKVQKANIMLGHIIRIFDYLDKNSYIRFHKAMVRPQLDGSPPNWNMEMLCGILINHICINLLVPRFTKTNTGHPGSQVN